MHPLRTLILVGSCLVVCLPSMAQKPGKLPTITKIPKVKVELPKPPLSPAHQQALRHAQWLQHAKAAKSVPPVKTPAVPEDPLQRPAHTPLLQAPTPPADPLQQKLAQLDRKIFALQQQNLLSPDAAVWHKTLATLPARKTPQMWLKLLEEYIFQYRQFPSNAKSSKVLYEAYHGLNSYLPPKHPVLLRMRQLRKQYPPRRALPKTTQQWMNELEDFVAQHHRFPGQYAQDPAEKALCKKVKKFLYLLEEDDPIVVRIRALKVQYPSSFVRKTPPERLDELEAFVAQHHRFPSQYAQNLEERALYEAFLRVLRPLPPDNPLFARLHQILASYAPARKTAQDWVDELQAFITQQNRLPSQHAQDPAERTLYQGVRYVLRRVAPEDPVAVQIYNLQRPYNKVPEQVLTRLEAFVSKAGYFPGPSIDGQEEKLYLDIKKILHELPADDPVAVQIRQLQRRYLTQ